jgi:hypothetical protein
MDEELEVAGETGIDAAVEAMMKSYGFDEDGNSLSDDDEETPDASEEGEDEDDTQDDQEDQDDEDHEDTDEDDSDDDSDEDSDEEEDDDDNEPADLGDDVEVTISVDGQDQRVSIGSLKRLAGQEASLTKKSQAIAEQRRTLENQGMYVAKVMQDRYEAAKTKVEKYKDVDLFRASRELEPDEFDALREAKEAAENELQTYEREGVEFLKRSQETRATILREQAKESLKIIAEKIPDWSDKLYDEIRTYAVSQGMGSDVVNEVVDPGAISMMHKAMLYDKAQSASSKVVKKITKAPKKTVSKANKVTDSKASKLKAMRRKAETSGDIDDVTELFLASMEE